MTCVPARALIRERSKSRAELFSLSQSCSAARSQRLLMSLYCCWISRLSKSVGEMVLMVSRLVEVHTFNLQGHRERERVTRVSACDGESSNMVLMRLDLIRGISEAQRHIRGKMTICDIHHIMISF